MNTTLCELQENMSLDLQVLINKIFPFHLSLLIIIINIIFFDEFVQSCSLYF